MKQHLFFTACFLFLQSTTFSQDLTGTWESTNTSPYEKMVLFHVGDSLFGYTHDIQMGFCKTNFQGTFNKGSQQLKGKGISFISKSFGHGLSRYVLNYRDYGSYQELIGNAYAKGAVGTMLSFGLPIPLRLKRTNSLPDSVTTFMNKHLQWHEGQPIKTNNQQIVQDTPTILQVTAKNDDTLKTELRKRKDVLVQTIETSDTVKLTLYDNGQIDGDTVTLFHNDSIILYKHGLTASAKMISFVVTESNSLQTITMMANNLGTIPPNTALLVIETNGKKYEISLSSDFSSNAMVKFIYKQ